MKGKECRGFKIGDKVKHRFRNNKYTNCEIIDISEGCNCLIYVIEKDVKSFFSPQDLEKIKKK